MKLVIDIGSNTIKCLLGEAHATKIDRFFEETIDSRICAPDGSLVPDAVRLIINAINKFVFASKNICECFDIIAIATSALRDAPNKNVVIAQVYAATSVKIKILSGIDEARLSYIGAVGDVGGNSTCAYFDLGGGSLELVIGEANNVYKSYSMPIGAVRLSGAFFKNEKISGAEKKKIMNHVGCVFAENISNIEPFDILVGAGGAVTAARLMKRRLSLSGAEKEISLSDMEIMFDDVCNATMQERIAKFDIPISRADIIPAAFATIIVLMRFLKSPKLIHTFCNLRYGIIQETK